MVESHASTAWDAIKRHGWLAVNLAGMGRSGEVSLDGFNSREARLSATRRRDRRKFALHRCIGHSIVGAFESKELELLELFTRWIVDKIWFYFFSFSSTSILLLSDTQDICLRRWRLIFEGKHLWNFYFLSLRSTREDVL